MTKACFRMNALRLMVTMGTSLNGVALLTAGCEPLVNPSSTSFPHTPTGISSPLPATATPFSPTETPTKTVEPTLNPYVSFSPFEKNSFSPEMQIYLDNLPGRQVAETGSTQEQQFITEDQAFHVYYLHGLIDYLGKQGMYVSTFMNYSDTDLLVYDNAIQVYEALWKQLAKNPESYNTEYVLTPWILEQTMSNMDNYVPQYTDTTGVLHYGIYDIGWTTKSIIDYFQADSIQEAIRKWRKKILDKFNCQDPIFGINLKLPVVMDGTGPTYDVLTALADHPGYPDGSVKIAIAGFIDENNHWIYQPFAVNLAEKTMSSKESYYSGGRTIYPVSEDQKYIIPIVGSSAPSTFGRKEYTLTDLIKMIDHQMYGTPNNVFGSPSQNIVFSQYFFDGIESFGVIQDGGKAPVSPLFSSAITRSPNQTS